MKKTLLFLLVVMMFTSVLLVSIYATGTDETDKGAECTCGGSYGAWMYPSDVTCVGGRYERVCDTCGAKQTAKDILPQTISFSVPAIGANTGDIVTLSLYDVYYTSSKIMSAASIVWSSEDIEIVNNQICPTVAGTYKLTATSGTNTKSVYLVVKNPTDTEYVLFADEFDRAELGSDYNALEVPTGTSYYLSDGKLIMDATGNTNNQMRILLPAWIGDFGDYKIDTSFTMLSTMNNDTSYWFAVMARIQSGDYPFWQAAVRKGAKSHSSGVEIARRKLASGVSNGWEVPGKGKYTENISADKYYNLTFNILGKTATNSIDGKTVITYNNMTYTSGGVGFHTRASVVSIDNVKIVVPIDDSIHNYGDWAVTKAATCTVNGVETRVCTNCDAKEERAIVAEHKGFGDWTIVTPATCTTKGTQQRVCASCGVVESATINATGHSLVKQAVKAPTCTESGYREYNICANCDYTTYSGEVEPYGHYFDRDIKVIAHRGYSYTAPENTLPAYILARELGFFYAECDVAFTKDGIAVLLHDTTIDRTSNGSGAIAELTYEELLQYDFGSWKNSKYAGTKIPTFEEFIALCKEIGLHPYIEIKNDGATYTQEQVETLVGIVRKYGMEDSCTWISFNLTYLEYVKNIDSTARLGYVSSKNVTQTMINSVKALQTGENEVFLDISYNMLNENNVMLAIQNGLAIETWTVDNTNDIKARPKYISGYTSNKLMATDTLVKVAVTEPTCASAGSTTYTCLCGETKVEEIPALEHNYEEDVTDPTCTENGYTTYTCADCGYSYVSDEVEATGHNYQLSGTTSTQLIYTCTRCEDSYTQDAHTHTEVVIPEIIPTPSTTGYTAGIECAECGEVIKAPCEVVITETKISGEFRLASVNLSLQENISINYWAEINEANYTDAYVVFVFRGTETVVFEYKIHATNGRRGYNFDGTFPQFMNDELETYLYAKTGEGTYAMQPHTYSVKQYCVSQFKKGDAALKTVISDVLTLGAMTQIYTGYKTNELITDIVKNEEGLTLTPTAYTSIPAECDKQLITGDKDAGTDWKSLSLLMGSSTQIKFTFICDDVENTTIKVNFGGEEKIFTSEDFQYDTDSARYYIVIDYVQSYMYDEVVTATFVRDGAEFGRVVNYSINTYLYKNAEKATQAEAARNLMKALYVYGVSIANYFGK